MLRISHSLANSHILCATTELPLSKNSELPQCHNLCPLVAPSNLLFVVSACGQKHVSPWEHNKFWNAFSATLPSKKNSSPVLFTFALHHTVLLYYMHQTTSILMKSKVHQLSCLMEQ